MLLSDKYPFLTEYFTKALSIANRPFPHCILFYGNDFYAQYTLACEIARFLNCKEDKSDNCECLNCRWIKEHSHPAVITISRLDNKPENDTSKTVISVKQAAIVREQIMNDSEFHRVFIFCGRDDDGNITGLNSKNFQEEAANSLLKSVEEPLGNVTFIFLTKYTEDILPTIVSRAQCFFVPDKNEVNYDYSSISGLFENYWEFKRKDVFDISKRLQDSVKEIGLLNILDGIQYYIFALLKNNPKNTELIKSIKVLEDCKMQAKLGIKPANIFDDLCLKLIK